MPAATPAPPALDAPAVEAFSEALGAFLRATRRARGRFAATQPDGEMSLSQFHLLDALDGAGRPLPVGELAISAGVSTPTATRMLSALEREGVVARERDEADRRVVRVRLTPDGDARILAKRELVRTWREEVFASLSPGEREQAASLLTALAIAIENHG